MCNLVHCRCASASLLLSVSFCVLKFVSPISIEARFVAAANSNFTMAAYEILKNESQFEIFSPLDLTTGLLALGAGARGPTERALKTGLLLDHIERHTLNIGMSDILNAVKEKVGQQVTFRSTLRILVPSAIVFWPEYASLLRSDFNNASILSNNAKSAQELKKLGWKNGQLGILNNIGKTRRPVKENANSDPVGVLLSAVEFLGPWKKKFGFLATRPAHFFVNQNDRLNVQMMNHDDYFHYAEFPVLDAAAIMLPFQGDRFGFIIVLPNSRLGLNFLEENLKRNPLHLIPKKLKRTWVDLWLPKFDLSSTIFFAQNGVLAKLGIGSILYPTADFGGISCGGDLYFTDVTQRTLISVNEEGLGGFKATVPRVDKLSSKTNRTTYNVDHPFLFFIYEYSTQSILILGRKVD